MLGRLTDVVKYLVIINVIMFVGTGMLRPDQWIQLALSFPGTEEFMPVQIVTHMFMHADIMHIAFNMLVLASLGPPLESILGPQRFLNYYFLCGFGSLLLHLLVTYISIQNAIEPVSTGYVLGASGAVYGVMVGFAMKFPNTQLMLLFPPIPVKAKFLVPILIGIDLVFGISGVGTGIAHFAHIGGAITGFLLITLWGNSLRRS